MKLKRLKSILLVSLIALSSLSASAAINSPNTGCIIYKDIKNVTASYKVKRILDLYKDKNKTKLSILSTLKKNQEYELFLENKTYGVYDLVVQALESDYSMKVLRLNLAAEEDHFRKSNQTTGNRSKFINLVQETLEKSLKAKIQLARDFQSEDCHALEFLVNGEIDHDLKLTEKNGLLVMTHFLNFGRNSTVYTISVKHYQEIAKRLFEEKAIKL